MIAVHRTQRYVKALYAAALQADALDAVRRSITAIESIFSKVEGARAFCDDPHSDRTVEMRFVEIALLPYVDDLCGRMIKAAVKNGRLMILPHIPAAFRQYDDEQSGRVTAVLETASEADSGLRNAVSGYLQARTDKNIELETRVLPELLGGFRLWWNGNLIEASVAGRIDQLRRRLYRM